MNWTHPICPDCYEERYPERKPKAVPLEMIVIEKCCDCGGITEDGIYFRADARTLAYPAVKGD